MWVIIQEAMNRVNKGISNRSNGVLNEAIGDIDGWLVKIRRPNYHMDVITNPVPFYSSKEHYALNVSCIVDSKRKFVELTWITKCIS